MKLVGVDDMTQLDALELAIEAMQSQYILYEQYAQTATNERFKYHLLKQVMRYGKALDIIIDLYEGDES